MGTSAQETSAPGRPDGGSTVGAATSEVEVPARRRGVDLAYRVALAALLAVGALGQIRVWASDRGLWNDEIYIANSLKYLRVEALTGMLLYKQIAPPGWLLGEKALLRIVGPDEQVLKLPEVAAALVVLALTAYAARQAIGRWGALVAVGLLCVAPLLYYYAGELKQYAFEAGIAMIIMVAFFLYGRVALERGTAPVRRAVAAGAVTGLVSAGSYSSLIVVAGAAAGVGVVQATRRQWRGVGGTALVALPGLAVGVYQAALRWQLGLMSNQHDYFSTGFPPEGAGPLEVVRWLPRMWQGFVNDPLAWQYPLLALLLGVGGLVALVLRGRPLWAGIIAGVFLAAVGAGALRGFPLEGRTAVYLIGPACVAVAAGVDGAVRAAGTALRDRGARRSAVRIAAAAVLGVAAVVGVGATVQPAAVDAYHQVEQPRYRDDARDMLRAVDARLQPGDVVIGYYFSEPMLTWYGRQMRMPLRGLAALGPAERCNPASVDQYLQDAKRVWYVQGAKLSWHPREYNDWVVGWLARKGTIVEQSTEFRPSRWTLIDLQRGPDPAPPPVGTLPDYDCLNIGRIPRGR